MRESTWLSRQRWHVAQRNRARRIRRDTAMGLGAVACFAAFGLLLALLIWLD